MVDDLAEFHESLGELLPQSGQPVDTAPPRLTDAQLEQFRHEGYVTGVRILTDEQVDLLRDELERIRQPDHPARKLWYEFHANESTDPATVLFHALGAWRLGRGFHDLLWLKSFVTPAEQLLGGPVRFWHDQLFCKPARHGGVVAWHQDYSYWTRTTPMAHLTCWIGLDESTTENGCLHYIPGSHQWELLPVTSLAGDMNAIEQVLNADQREQFRQPVAIELQPGEASFHHPLMLHGSFENRTDRPRRAAVLNVIRDGVCSASSEPLLAGVPPVPAGEPLAGRFFPLLSPGS